MAVGRPFQKGQSGNPSGRPKSAHVRAEIMRQFRENPGDVEAIVKAQIDKAKGGDTQAFKAVVEWVEPAIPKTINVADLSPEQAAEILALCEDEE